MYQDLLPNHEKTRSEFTGIQMEMTAVASPVSGSSDQQKFVINMLASPKSQPFVRSCEIVGPNMRQRTSFGENSAIEDVFENRVAQGLRDCLERLEGGQGILSLPELLIEVEGLILVGVHLMVRQLETGERAFIFRFRTFVGLLQRIYHPRLGLTDPMAGLTDNLALAMLCDVGLPLLDICATHEGRQIPDDRLDPMSKSVLNNAHELRFRLELIKRFLKFSSPAGRLQPQVLPDFYDRRIKYRSH
ncbi:hypothetical protein ABMC89_10630 [Sulfitobacter sp. HNIBRBA3233]|uniref:hypothetical protein n=1 Tax=Sulfitobacter marinivivus TaxID=3158558 RepID=UPI0032E02955